MGGAYAQDTQAGSGRPLSRPSSQYPEAKDSGQAAQAPAQEANGQPHDAFIMAFFSRPCI